MHEYIKMRLQTMHSQIIGTARQFGRDPNEIQLLAVSKDQPLEKIKAAIAAGQTHFAENYVQQAVEKIHIFQNEPLTWHFIGRIQSKKCKQIVQYFQWVHSVDRLEIAQRLNDYRANQQQPLNVCIQVNVSEENSKNGLTTYAQIRQLADAIQILPKLRLRGLMTIATTNAGFVKQRQDFQQLRTFFNQLRQDNFTLDTLSMGMSYDFMAAIAEGATFIRIGSAIFGERIN